jgi:hypothetical protein
MPNIKIQRPGPGIIFYSRIYCPPLILSASLCKPNAKAWANAKSTKQVTRREVRYEFR